MLEAVPVVVVVSLEEVDALVQQVEVVVQLVVEVVLAADRAAGTFGSRAVSQLSRINTKPALKCPLFITIPIVE